MFDGILNQHMKVQKHTLLTVLVGINVLFGGGTLLVVGMNNSKKETNLRETNLSKETIEKILENSSPVVQPNRNDLATLTCPRDFSIRFVSPTIGEEQTEMKHTEHCPKCNLGALSSREDTKVCSYCESVFAKELNAN